MSLFCFRLPRPRAAACWRAALLSLLLAVLLLPLAPVRADAGRWLGSPGYGELSAEIASLRPMPGRTSTSLSAAQQQRYADLLALQAAIVRSDDRSQVDNRTSHSLGVFARSKKAPVDATAEFLVLAPGHETDDDFDVVGVYVPAGVALAWGDGHGAAAASAPRLARLLEGQVLTVSEPAVAATSPAPAASTAGSPKATPITATSATAATAGATRSAATPSGNGPASANPSGASRSDAAPQAYRFDLPAFAVLSSSDQVAAIPALTQAELDAHPETAPVD